MARRRRPGKRPPLPPVILLGLFIIAGLFYLYFERGELAETPDSGSAGQSSAAEALPADGLMVYFFDIGQGDSELIRIPDGGEYFDILIDTGEYEYAEGLTDSLKKLGVNELDIFILSHPHTDHMGSAATLVREFDIGSLYMPRVPLEQTPTTTAYERLLEDAEEKGLSVEPIYASLSLPVPEGAVLSVLSPEEGDVWEEMNNYSAVIKLEYGETSFLFTGDAEKEIENLMLEYGYDVSADVLKCGHHGSSTSSKQNFLWEVAPELTVISCGRDNRYGHPTEDTLKNLETVGSEIFRTDRDKTVLITSDKKELKVRTGLDSVSSSE